MEKNSHWNPQHLVPEIIVVYLVQQLRVTLLWLSSLSILIYLIFNESEVESESSTTLQY